MTYSITLSGAIVRDVDGAQLPADPNNSDYAAYLVWVAAGNTATPAYVDIELLKLTVKSNIRDFRDNLLLLTPFVGKLFQSDISSKIQIMVVASQPVMPLEAASWRTADNSYAVMTLQLFQELMGTIMTREGAAFANSAFHQDAVDKLLKVSDVSAYDYSIGWPT